MALIGAQRIQGPDAENAYDAAENIGLFVVEVDQFFGSVLYEIDGGSYVGDS